MKSKKRDTTENEFNLEESEPDEIKASQRGKKQNGSNKDYFPETRTFRVENKSVFY